MNPESEIQREIEIGVNSFPHISIFRNNVGSAKKGKRYIRYGLKTGSADYIGWETKTITPDMVGKKVAVFLSIEVKDTGKHIEPGSEQEKWLNAVKEAGGIAMEADSLDVCLERLDNYKL